MIKRLPLSTGLSELDDVFRGLMPGDNLVWQVDSVDDYLPFVEPYARYAQHHAQLLIYFQFATHPPLLSLDSGAVIHKLNPEKGFEEFITSIHQIIDSSPPGTCYLFDCLSELAGDWKSDRMLGNFFMLTCPYLYDRAAIAYFALFRNYHSFHAVNPITDTAQILVNVYRHKEKLYIHPIKVHKRHSATMYTLHVREGERFLPVTQSCIITDILSGVQWSRLDSASFQLGFWSKTFADAEHILGLAAQGQNVEEDVKSCFSNILHMLISHHEQVLALARKHFSLEDLLEIRKRMIGTGLIGGKAVGMLLARKILSSESPDTAKLLEAHDSFFVGADVFYTYLVQNGYWWLVQKSKATFGSKDSTHETVRRRMLTGEFPEYIVKQFSDMLDYFGQSPIIVRSSSLLEDNFGNAFAGKYESVFCANQGERQKRLDDFLNAVRTVYASTMSEEALAYRAKRNLLKFDEQMGLLIQRVSGARYGDLFFPQAAGVGFSFNPYVWHKDIDPKAGMLRLVFGMGTRAVDREDTDYTRVVALNAPLRRPEASVDKVRQYSQRRVDVIDLQANQLTSKYFDQVVEQSPALPLDIFADIDRQQNGASVPLKPTEKTWLLTFGHLLSNTAFVQDMREMLGVIQRAYDYAVDVEFTLNFLDRDHYRINLVQCRPLQVADPGTYTDPPHEIAQADLVFRSVGPVIGRSSHDRIDWVIYVVPSSYGKLSMSDRYRVAGIIGDLTRHKELEGKSVMLVGPGRWGTTTPALGVPVSASDIQSVSVLCEIVIMHENLVPDVSLGTHFFNELVENNLLYLALFPSQRETTINLSPFETLPNKLVDLLPEEHKWTSAIHVAQTSITEEKWSIRLNANPIKQRAVCYFERQSDA